MASKPKRVSSKKSLRRVKSEQSSSNSNISVEDIKYYTDVNDSVHNLNDSSKNEEPEQDYIVTLNFDDLERHPEELEDPIDREIDWESLSLKNTRKVHSDVGSKLDYVYDDRGLTVITEEPSKQNTEFNFEGNRQTDRYTTNTSNRNWRTSSNKARPVNFSKNFRSEEVEEKLFLGKSIEDAVRMGEQGKLASKKGRFAKSMSMNFKKRKKLDMDSEIIKKKNFTSDFKKKKDDSEIKIKEAFLSSKETKEDTALTPEKTQDSLGTCSNPDLGIQFCRVNMPQFIFSDDESITLSVFSQNSIVKDAKNSAYTFTSKTALPRLPRPKRFTIILALDLKLKTNLDKKKSFVKSSTLELENGLFYRGDLKFGKISGSGSLFFRKKGEGEGLAKEEIVETEKEMILYEGGFLENKMEGRGKLFFDGHGSFEGTFKENRAHGFGKLEGADLLVEGIWINGILDE